MRKTKKSNSAISFYDAYIQFPFLLLYTLTDNSTQKPKITPGKLKNLTKKPISLTFFTQTSKSATLSFLNPHPKAPLEIKSFF